MRAVVLQQDWYRLRSWKVLFSSSFAYSLDKEKEYITRFVSNNEYISRDESLHVAHAVMLYGKLQNI